MAARRGVGGFFKYAGLGLGVLGAVILVVALGSGGGFASMGGLITGGTLLMIGVIWAAVGGGLGMYYGGVSARNQAEEQLFQTGQRATAEITGVQQTATTINENPQIVLHLRVKPRTGAEFDYSRKMVVPVTAIPMPGNLVEVAYNPGDTSKVALQCDPRLDAPPARYVITRPPGQPAPGLSATPAAATAAAPTPLGPGEDKLDALEKLGRLKAQGVLSDSEFQVQKARILSGL